MAAGEGSLLFKEELSAKRTIIRGNPEGSSQTNNDPAELLSIFIEQVGSCVTSSSDRDQWFNSIANAAESSAGKAQGPKIPKVPDLLCKVDSNKDCYDPVVVSIGPYHHGKRHLQEIEKLKIKWANQFVADIDDGSQTDLGKVKKLNGEVEKVADLGKVKKLYEEVEKVADEARKYDDIGGGMDSNEKFTRMMFLDGCFILQFIHLLVQEEYHKMGMTNNQIINVKRDLFLLENQLPYIVLVKLMSKQFEGNVQRGNEMIEKFINICRRLPPSVKPWRFPASKYYNFIIPTFLRGVKGDKPNSPLHLLDMTRTSIVEPDATNQGGEQDKNRPRSIKWYSYYSAKVLKSKGIRFSPNKTGSYSDVKFSSIIRGVLTLPPIFIDTSTRSFLLNMAAFEANQASTDPRGITSYICFMDSLIHNAEDVMILRTQNVIVNCLGSDELVAQMFNDIAKDLVPNPNTYAEAKLGIQRHCNNKFKKWMAECLHIHCRSPWTLLALFGALFAIILTCAQTYLAAKPPKI